MSLDLFSNLPVLLSADFNLLFQQFIACLIFMTFFILGVLFGSLPNSSFLPSMSPYTGLHPFVIIFIPSFRSLTILNTSLSDTLLPEVFEVLILQIPASPTDSVAVTANSVLRAFLPHFPLVAHPPSKYLEFSLLEAGRHLLLTCLRLVPASPQSPLQAPRSCPCPCRALA